MEALFQYFIYLVLFVELLLCFKKSIYGLCGLITIRVLIPEIVRISFPISLSLNTYCVIFLLLGLLKERQNIKITEPLPKTIILFFIFFFLTLLLSDYTDLKYQSFSTLKLFLTDYLPAVLAYFIINDKYDISLFAKVLSVSIIISCIYAFVTIIIGTNPYNLLINILYKEDFNLNNVLLDGGTAGTFAHPNGFGFFIPIAFSFFVIILSYDKSKLYYLVLLLLLIGAIGCQKRTCFISLFIYFAFIVGFSNIQKKIKYISYALFVGVIFLLIIISLPKSNRVSRILETSLSFWDDKIAERNNITGSSFEMRMEQITYPFVMIKDNIWFGKGSGYIDYYQNVEGNLSHPILKGFETLPCKIELETGIFGFFIWAFFLLRMMKHTSINDINRIRLFRGLWLSQITVWLASGFSSFAVFGVLVVSMSKLDMLKNQTILCTRYQ